MPQYDLTINVIGKDKSSGIFAGLSSGLGKILQVAGGIVAARVFMALADQIGNVVVAAINATAQFQNMEIGLQGLVARELSRLTDGAQTIADVFPQAEIAAEGLMDQLSKIAIVSPYMVDAVMQTFRMQMAFGFTTDQAMKLTNGLLNMAAGIGATQPMLQRMAYNLAQINLQGKVTKLDIRQLALAGLGLVDVLKYVGKEMGVEVETHLDFNKAIEDGAITWADFATLFEKYATENFAGASERMARTLVGLKSTFNDVFVLTMPKLIGPAVEAVTKSLNKILDIFIFLRESGLLEEWGEVLAEHVTNLIGPFDDFLGILLRYFEIMQLLKNPLRDNKQYFESLRKELLKLSPTGDIVFDALNRVFGPKAAEWYVQIRKSVLKLVEAFVWFQTVAAKVRDSIGIVFEGFGKFWEKYGVRISDAVTRVANSLLGLGDEGIQSGLEGIEGFAERIATWLEGAGGEAIAAGFENFAIWIEEIGIPAAREFATWLEEKLPEALESLSNFYYETLKPAFEDFGTTWREDIMPGFENLQQFWQENGDAILEVLGKFVENLFGITLSNANENLTNLGTAFETGTASMVENGPSIVENLTNITGAISTFVDVMTDPNTVIIAGTLLKIAGALWGFNQAVAALAGVKATLLGISAPLATLGTYLGGFWGLVAGLSWGAAIYAAAKIDEALSNIRDNLETAVSDYFDDFIEAGRDLLNGIHEGMGDKWAEIATWFIDTITAWIIGILTGDVTAMGPLGPIGFVLSEAGENLAQGLWDGFASTWETFKAWILSEWAALQASWDAFWDNHSPSGVTKKLGENIGQGLIDGLQGSMSKFKEMTGDFGISGTLANPLTYETITIPVTIGSISSDVDIEELFIRLSERQQYERAMRRR